MNHAVTRPRLVSFWEGPVAWVERLCVASMLRHGHEVTIYTYDTEALIRCDLGCCIRDGREVIAEKDVAHRYRAAGSLRMFANLFRLELQRQDRGIWVDLDCYLIKPLLPQSEYVFGLVSPHKLNNAVLRLPADCPMIGDYISAITADPLRTPWSTFRRRLWREIEILTGRTQPGATVRTSLGPRALTYFARKHNILKHAMPREAYYPIGTREVHLLADPNPNGVTSKLTAQTVLVHLWRAYFPRLGLLAELPPDASYLGKACAEFGISS